ncbi:MAG: hypothetical protein JWO71_4441 [Candidatus Acidoferrum typicum]|nr:hypothetical protein [Candidatus Acidoferrum typicum]
MWGSFFGLVAIGGWEIPIPLYGVGIDFALDGYEGVEKLVRDVGEDGGTARGDPVLHDEDKELGEELVDLVGGLKIVELDQEMGGQVDVNGLRRLDLECGMAKAKAGAQGAKAAATAASGEMTALCVGIAGKRDSGGAGCLRIHSLSFLGVKGGYTPVAIERVRKALIPKQL